MRVQESEVTDTCVSNCSGNARHNIQQQRAHSKRELLVELDGKTERRAEKKHIQRLTLGLYHILSQKKHTFQSVY